MKKILILSSIMLGCFNLQAQEIESGIYNCVQQKMLGKGLDWKNTCDSMLYVLLNKPLPENKHELLNFAEDTSWRKKAPVRLQYKMLFISLDTILNNIFDRCVQYFAHRDGHESSINGEIAGFIQLYNRKAERKEYLDFYRNLSEEIFMQPFYLYVFISWILL
jgi:hypothetical protein